MARDSTDFLAILDAFVDRLTDSGAILFPNCHQIMTKTAKDIMEQADLHYVPGYKVTELMADLVNLAASISSEGWLSTSESATQFSTLTARESLLVQSFLSEAAMEKARYEPIMLTERHDSPLNERNAILRLRLKRMLDARQQHDPLPSSYIRAIRMAGSRAIHASCFASYRPGPMLQLFDEMVRQVNHIAEQTLDEFEGLAAISYVLREDGSLWKRYRYKAPRFAAKPGDPLHEGAFVTRANMLYVPDQLGRPTLH